MKIIVKDKYLLVGCVHNEIFAFEINQEQLVPVFSLSF